MSRAGARRKSVSVNARGPSCQTREPLQSWPRRIEFRPSPNLGVSDDDRILDYSPHIKRSEEQDPESTGAVSEGTQTGESTVGLGFELFVPEIHSDGAETVRNTSSISGQPN
jgi:hypothetical protein